MENIQCEMPDYTPPNEEIQQILQDTRTIAVVGLSPKEERDSNRVARYLMEKGFEVVPVNPGQKEILGKTCYASLQDIPFQVDMADLFLNPSRIPQAVDQAMEKKVRFIWMQQGIVHNEAAAKARAAGIQVVMNRCVMREHQKIVKQLEA